MSETQNTKFVPNHDSIFSAYEDLIADATMQDMFNAATWYSEAQSYALQLATCHVVSLDQAAGVIAAFSPRTRWAQNVLNAELFLSGEPVPTMINNVKMANAVVDKGIDGLKGRKTNSFAHNIAGNMNKVTIDVWMIRAAGYDRLDANKGMYDLMENVIIELSEIYSVSPAQLQALIWIVVRGSHV
jgi:hypothetical protein